MKIIVSCSLSNNENVYCTYSKSQHEAPLTFTILKMFTLFLIFHCDSSCHTVSLCQFLFSHSFKFSYIQPRWPVHHTYLYWFPPQNEEVLCSHHHETHELMAQNLLNLICLQHQWTVRITDTGLILTWIRLITGCWATIWLYKGLKHINIDWPAWQRCWL